MRKVPLYVQFHQLVDVEAETNVRDSAAGVGLAAGRGGGVNQEGEVSASTGPLSNK